jgi:hypothetical protein
MAFKEPVATPSILATVPDILRKALQENIDMASAQKRSILISSNSLANRFILERWDIRSSQRRRYRNLFMTVRRHCRSIFQNLLVRKRITWETEDESHFFGIFRFDEVRGNLILGFVPATKGTEWALPR